METEKKYERRKVSPEEHERVKALQKRYDALKNERATWIEHWRDLADHLYPRGLREYQTDTNQTQKEDDQIINGDPLFSRRTLSGGMMAGITSPSRPWFRLTIRGSNSEVRERSDVKTWLADTESVLREAIAQTNIYKALPALYEDMGPFGMSVLLIDEDAEDVARAYNFTVGTYVLAKSARGDIDTIIRECSMTAGELAEQFGEENLSKRVCELLHKGDVDTRVDVMHAIHPNREYVPGKLGPKGKMWASHWWERGAPEDCGFLRESGYEEKPFMSPRWAVVGDDTYAYGPGDMALSDCKALQMLEKRKAQLVESLVNPPMTAPSAAMTSVIRLTPGVVDYVDALGAGQGLRPAFEVQYQAVAAIAQEIETHKDRIRQAFFADLWLMLQQVERQMTAREVQERREEKLLQLGTVLESLQDELLDPLIDRMFAILLRAGRIPEPPDVLQGAPLRVEYISIMASAQKLLSVSGIERITTFAANLAAVAPDVLDKVDIDQVIDELADSLGVPPAMIRADEAVEALRMARQQAAAKQAQVEQAAQVAGAARDLSQASLEGENGLTAIARGMGVA